MISIIIRTLNEARNLGQTLEHIKLQEDVGDEVEVVLVDSGSVDDTLKIAESYSCRIFKILKSEFSFGRSLNIGCDAARGDLLVFLSGHCVPSSKHWLRHLTQPLREAKVAYTYGRQMGTSASQFSECRLFLKYFPELSRVPQVGFFCNNANAAILRSVWANLRFDEDLTGLEDMDLAKKLTAAGLKVGYCAEAGVFHHHNETWKTIRRRYEREAIALQKIMPEIHLTRIDVLRYFLSAVFMDFGAAIEERRLLKVAKEIIFFRLMQFWGSYTGNREHRLLSRKAKEIYFYPSQANSEIGQKT